MRANADAEYIMAKINPVSGPNLPVNKLRKQISNIKQYEVPRHRTVFGVYDKNDRISCMMKFNELARTWTGICVNNVHNVSDLKDAYIVLATKEQLHFLLKYGSNLIMVDSTFGVTSYNLKLTTFIVIDEFGKGIPVVNIISNSLDTKTWKKSLKHIRNKVGEIRTAYFMSDGDTSYHNAWKRVMEKSTSNKEKPSRKLVCTWHVSKAWNRKLVGLGISNENRRKIMHLLIKLKSSLTHLKFCEELEKIYILLSQSKKGKKFIEYLHKRYLADEARIAQWADYKRIFAGISTNNYCESFFNIVKSVCFKKLRNHRLDVLVHKLLILSQNSLSAYYSRCANECGFKERRMNELHRYSENMNCDMYVDETGKWNFFEGGDTIRVCEMECDDCECVKKCKKCGGCMERFMCECAEYMVNMNVCKHIHYICMNDINVKNSLPSNSNVYINQEPQEQIIPDPPAVQDLREESLVMLREINRLYDNNLVLDHQEGREALNKCLKKLLITNSLATTSVQCNIQPPTQSRF